MRISDNDSDRRIRSRTYKNTATTVLYCRGCCSDDWISCASCLATDKQPEKLCSCHWATSVSHAVFTIRFLSEYSGGNFAPADLIIMTV